MPEYYHSQVVYLEAFKDFNKPVTNFLGVGKDSVAIELADGRCLEIGAKPHANEHGKRPYDIPIEETGTFDNKQIVDAIEKNPFSSKADKTESRDLILRNRVVSYMIQPKAQTNIPTSIAERFRNHMPKIGQEFADFGANQLGFFDGRVVLLDYFAVEPIRMHECTKANMAAQSETPLIDRLIEAALT